ncbi:MAG: type II toxin-antitoxin system VapC family toxin [Chloroflexi bacterium]|nr:type II toxin-antitoxin system VapC family toxin [Chloroflexota bacterium]
MNYLIDSDWVADYLKGRTEALDFLRSLGAEGLAISLVTYGEIYEGIYYGPNAESHEAGFRKFLQWVDVLPLNRRIMQRFARIRGQLRKQGQLIGDPDILIAATALHNDLTLVSRNLKHFQRIANLKLH